MKAIDFISMISFDDLKGYLSIKGWYYSAAVGCYLRGGITIEENRLRRLFEDLLNSLHENRCSSIDFVVDDVFENLLKNYDSTEFENEYKCIPGD